jgi:hypothetical protein
MGAIDHAPEIILRAFTGTGVITSISWQALYYAIQIHKMIFLLMAATLITWMGLDGFSG